MPNTLADTIAFNFDENDTKRFDEDQRISWGNIEKHYQDLKQKCLDDVKIPATGTHKEWIKSRVKLHETTSLVRLLYLVESFCDNTLKFNSVAAAANVKAMVEIPLHLGYLVWTLYNRKAFSAIREDLAKVTFGNRDASTGLTSSSRISQKDLYSRADQMMKIIFKGEASRINIFEALYKESNAIGHHNYEGRNVLTGNQSGDVWKIQDRKDQFIFLSNNIFQFFFYCDAILSMSSMLTNAIDHYLNHLPDYFKDKGEVNPTV